jgi:hypothetical protein
MHNVSDEEWRPVVGSTNYEVSNHGRVMSYARSKSRLLSLGSGTGYYTASINRRAKYVHRLVVEAFIGPAPDETYEVAHIDGNPLNNHVSNLRWATHSENLADRVRHNTHLRGERTSKVLTWEQVREMRALLADGMSQLAASRKYGVSRTTVIRIARHERWVETDLPA